MAGTSDFRLKYFGFLLYLKVAPSSIYKVGSIEYYMLCTTVYYMDEVYYVYFY